MSDFGAAAVHRYGVRVIDSEKELIWHSKMRLCLRILALARMLP